MDLTNVAILTTAAWGAIALVLVVVAWIFTSNDVTKIPAGPRVIVCVLVAPLVVLLVSISEWGDTVRVTPKGDPLGDVSLGGLLLIGLFLAILEAGVYAGIDKLVWGIANSGMPMPTAKQRERADAMADKYAQGQQPNAGGQPRHGVTEKPLPSSADLDRAP